MTHIFGHVECGGVGQILRWAKLIDGDNVVMIPVYSRAFVNVIFMGEGVPHKKVERAKKQIADFRHKFYQTIAQPGEEIHYESPDPPSEPPHDH